MKRALSTPARAFGLLFFVLAQTWWIPRFWIRDSEEIVEAMRVPGIALPPIQTIDAAVFGMFAILMVFMGLNVFGYAQGFRSADVDVLFPTPVSRRAVLHLRMARDVLITLVVPLLFGLLLFRPAQAGWANLFADLPDPALANTVFRMGFLSWLLLALGCVMVGYAVSLSVANPHPRVERIAVWARWVVGVGTAAVVLLVADRLRAAEGYEGMVAVAHSPDLRAVFFLATGATSLTLAPLTEELGRALLGGSILLGTILVAYSVAVGRTDWMYEQAALRAAVTESTQKVARQGDFYALVNERARQGKVKVGRIGVLDRLRPTGAAAILWKEAVVARRAGLGQHLFFALLAVVLGGLAATLPVSRRGLVVNGVLLLAMQAFGLFGSAAGASQAGFIETLRRIDLLKPLPFSGQATVALEALGRAVPAALGAWLGLGLAWALRPSLGEYAFAGMVVFPPFAVSLAAFSVLLVLLLPDVEDPAQRGFRGFVTLLGLVALTLPPILVFAGLSALMRLPAAVAAFPTAGVLVALAWLLTRLAGTVYRDFNPSE